MRRTINPNKIFFNKIFFALMIIAIPNVNIIPRFSPHVNKDKDASQVKEHFLSFIFNDYTSKVFLNPTSTTNLNIIKLSILTAPDAEALDEFGGAVATSRQYIVVGARGADINSGETSLINAGAVYVYERNGGVWSQAAKLVARDAQSEDAFGTSVAIYRDTILVGAPGHDLGDQKDAGAVYVFVRSEGEWLQQAKLIAEDAKAEDNFGVSVAIDGNYAIIGADGKDLGYIVDAGTAYVFVRNQGKWKQQATLTAEKPKPWDNFGTSVAIGNHRVAVGACEAGLIGNLGTGIVHVFVQNGKSWNLEAKLSPEDGQPGDFFGHSVAISDDTIAVGALFNDPWIGKGRLINAGATYIFTFHNGEWKQKDKIVPIDAQSFDQFGQSVALYGKYLLVGANHKSIDNQFGAGATYLYLMDNNHWRLKSEIIAEQPREDDNFGHSVALYEDYLVIGANGRESQNTIKAGEAYIYRFASIELPETGFAPLPINTDPPPKMLVNSPSISDLWLEIPSIGVYAPIVGIAQNEQGWDISWLWDQIGYLYGTAFPTWQGNTALVGHVNLPNGQPGPFANLPQLTPSNKVIIHAWGKRYIYVVRETLTVFADDLSILRHEDSDWITLITCNDYDPISGHFRKRWIIRAVLSNVENEP